MTHTDAFGYEQYEQLPKVNGKLLRKTFERVFEEAQKPTIEDLYDKYDNEDEAEAEIEELAKTTGVCRWNQGDWFSEGPPCGTAGCFAGWAYMITHSPPSNSLTSFVPTAKGDVFISEWAQDELGLTTMEADNLFAPSNDIEDLRRSVNTILMERTRSKKQY